MFSAQDEYWMQQALMLADQAAAVGEVPVGAILVEDDMIISAAFNQPISQHDPCAHAEILALRSAAKKKENYRLVGTTLYVTLEPCMMCAAALIHARVARLVYAASEPRAGGVVSQAKILDQAFVNHRVQYTGGLLAGESRDKLQRFFQSRRTS